MKKYRVWAEIDLGKVAKNVASIRKRVGQGVKILVVVKADAYGHGAIAVAKTAIESGANMLGVGDSSEAIELHEAGILAPMLVLGALIEEEIGWVVSHGIMPTIHSGDMISTLNTEARRQGKKLKVHLKVDTGMGRLGASPKQAVELARKIAGCSHLELEGVCTHLSAIATGDKAFTRKQLEMYKKTLDEVMKLGINIPCRHAANSASLVYMPESVFNVIRPGAAVYGINPTGRKTPQFDFVPILTLKTQITFLKGVEAGATIGYNKSYVTPKRTKIATLPVGYNDGYPYALSNRGYALVKGKMVPVVGSVTMDYTMIDVGHVPGVSVGDEVVLIGRQGDAEISAEDIATLVGTVPYEITCRLGKRVKRVYVQAV
jgi:alanine racemase